jgi:serine/threonine protein kinase
MELASNGELFDIIAPVGGFSENIARYYFKSFLESLAYLHDNGICHRDLKPENLLLTDDWKLKIADFGFSVKKSVCGTN